MNLKNRLDNLESQLGMDDSPILFRLEPKDWVRIKLNRNIPVIYLHPDKNDHDWDERLAEIERLKKAVNRLTLFSQSDGYAVWENGECINDGGLGHE